MAGDTATAGLTRDEARPDSDVDIPVTIDDSRKFSLVDLAGLRLDLCDTLGRDVDIVERDYLKPFLRDAILAEAPSRSSDASAPPAGGEFPPYAIKPGLCHVADSLGIFNLAV